ncbi:extracellular solute-binding protein [Calidifontibacillus oryziterrae]|uniref:extracellular solute-binding protein n=1 Tax=Calidifontibacillus oryziterrae TaxID=1191699 RepID=UPI0002F40377|nr:extracellular solute-binding protein [Calidifontibacillus oryziterrae]
MRRFISIGFLLLLLSLIISCGLIDTTKQVGEEVDNNESTPTISIIGDGPNTMELLKMEEDEILRRFGVRLSYHYPERITENLEDYLFNTNEKYDIYILFPVKIPLYVERGLIAPLDPYISEPIDSDILPIYRNMFMSFDDHYYGMVYDGDSHLLFYRKDIFQRYNDEYKQLYGVDLTPPQNWSEYDRIAKFLTRDTDLDGKIDIHGTATLNGDGMRYIWFCSRFLSMGGSYFDEEMNPLIESSIGLKALNDLVVLNNGSGVPPKSMFDWTDLNNVFLQGKVAMIIQWSDTGRFSYDEKSWGSKVSGKVDWDLVPGGLPNAPRGGVWLGRVLAISNEAADPEKAWQIIEYITSKDVSKRGTTSYETGTDPFRYSHFTVDENGPFPTEQDYKHFLTTVQKSLLNTNTDLIIPGSWEYMQSLDRNVGLALIQKLTPEEALRQTAEEWQDITNKYGRQQQKEYYGKWLEKLEKIRSEQQQ